MVNDGQCCQCTKTAKQAEADWIIGIGKTHNESGRISKIFINCENKLIGDDDTDPCSKTWTFNC